MDDGEVKRLFIRSSTRLGGEFMKLLFIRSLLDWGGGGGRGLEIALPTHQMFDRF